MNATINHDPLIAGFYSVRFASDFLGIPYRKVVGWLSGYPNSNAEPVIDRDFQHSNTVSFLDLMELRFIDHFRAQGVSMHTIRLSATRARHDWNTGHPFALSKAKYITDRRAIFAQIAKESGDKPTWDMASGQHEIWEMIESQIARGVEFDPKTQLARTWEPMPERFPNVIIDPRMAFGKPSIKGRGVPTSVLFRQWKADGRKSAVAEWFHVSEEDVDQAIRFELSAAA